MDSQRQQLIEAWMPDGLAESNPTLTKMLWHIMYLLNDDEFKAALTCSVRVGTLPYKVSCNRDGHIIYRCDIELVNFAGGAQTCNELGLEVLHELAHIILDAAGINDSEESVNWWTWENCERFGLKLPHAPPFPRPKDLP
jgi:hypothetical protein